MSERTNDDVVGFVGLGHLGGTMAARVADHGHALVVFDPDEERAAQLAERGADVLGSPREVAERAGVVFTCLPSEEAAYEAVLGDDGVATGAGGGTGVVECSTVSPATARQLAAGVRQRGAPAIDAAVSGSEIPAQNGEIVFLVGGDRELYDRCAPIFDVLAKQTFFMGDSGAGATTKLVVNTLLGVNMQAIAEAVALGLASGLDAGRLFDVLAANATIGEAHRPKIENARDDEYPVNFALRLMHKDFGLVLEQAREVGAVMPATAAAHAMCTAEHNAGREEDFSAVVRLMRELSGERG
jgi:3-hydroxyisobutyrate dehydrogenase-like beta-hydroxyacid dehydrogenase